MEDNLKILKVEYFSNHWLDLLSNFKINLTKTKIAWNEDNLQWKPTLKYYKWNISATTDWIFLKF